MGAHALLIGISQFEDPKLAKLNSPTEDVQAFADVLKDSQRGGFDTVELSINQDLLTIRDQLSSLMDGRSTDDMVLLYYSGHGIVAKGQRLYLATGQSSFERPQSRSVATSEIRDLMEQSRASRLVVILDCCHSGVFAEGAKGGEAAAMTSATFGEIDGAEGQYILTATDALQFAYDGAGELREAASGPTLSRFTRWLVEGIGKGEAAPFDENITLDSLYQYLCRRARAEQAGMNPQRFVKRGSGEIVIAKNPAGKQLELPQNVVGKLDSPQWQMRKEAVTELAALAKQKPMMPLVKKAILDRISDERDVEVREGMVSLLQRLGVQRAEDLVPPPAPEPQADTKPKPRQWQAKQDSGKQKPAPQPIPLAPVTLPDLDEWQTRVLIKSGVQTGALTIPNAAHLVAELKRRAIGLRIATYFHRAAIAFSILFGLGAIGNAQNKEDGDGIAAVLLIMIGFGIAGLVNRRSISVDPQFSGDAEMKRLAQAVPLISSRWGWSRNWSKREYEASLFHRGCWWLAIGGVLALLGVLVQN